MIELYDRIMISNQKKGKLKIPKNLFGVYFLSLQNN